MIKYRRHRKEIKMKLYTKIASALVLSLALVGCSSTQSEPQTEDTTDETTQIPELDSLIQFQDSYPDDMQVAIMNTDQGEIDFVLFADQAPKAVENFVTHAKEGYYNGVTFHRVIDDFMIQTGDPTGTGSGGESIWGEPFEDEFSYELYNFRGAVSMANSGEDTNGSQFFIVQASTMDQELNGWPTLAEEKYHEVGGTPWLDQVHTVFGQVISGMDVVDAIADLEDILANHDRVLKIIRDDLTEINKKYGDDRRTEISDASFDMEDEDLIPVEDVIIMLTESGYIKRQSVDTYKAQNRGGRGIKSLTLNEEDSIDTMISMSTHDYLLLFTNTGRVYRMRGFNVPNASRTSKGIPIVNLLTLEKGEQIKTLQPVPKDYKFNDIEFKNLLFVTKNGIVKRTSVSEFENINRNGKIAISLKEDDELAFVKLTTGNDEIIIAGSNGKAVRFNEDQIRVMGRSAAGVTGFNCDGSEVVGVALSNEGKTILSISENGYGKRSYLEDYRLTSRGKKGVRTINITEKTGKLVSVKAVNGDEDVMIVSSSGIMIRTSLQNVGIYGRNTQGVRLINLTDDAKVTKVTLVDHEEEETSEK